MADWEIVPKLMTNKYRSMLQLIATFQLPDAFSE